MIVKTSNAQPFGSEGGADGSTTHETPKSACAMTSADYSLAANLRCLATPLNNRETLQLVFCNPRRNFCLHSLYGVNDCYGDSRPRSSHRNLPCDLL